MGFVIVFLILLINFWDIYTSPMVINNNQHFTLLELYLSLYIFRIYMLDTWRILSQFSVPEILPVK